MSRTQRTPAEIRIIIDEPLPGLDDAIRCLRVVETRRRVEFGDLLALLHKFTPGGTDPGKVCLASIRAYPPITCLCAMIDLAISLIAKEFVFGLDLQVRPCFTPQLGTEFTSFSS